MRRWLPTLLLALLWAAPAPAAGLLIPSDNGSAPLDMVDHKVLEDIGLSDPTAMMAKTLFLQAVPEKTEKK